MAPFHSAIMQSNAIMLVSDFPYSLTYYVLSQVQNAALTPVPTHRTTPKTPAELCAQFEALCRALSPDPASPTVLATLRDPTQVPAEVIMHAIETDALGIEHGTFRGAWEPAWLGDTDPMAWQRSGELARGLRAHGVRSVVVGEVSEEWYLYSIAHPVASVDEFRRNLERYYQKDIVEKMLDVYLGQESGPGGKPLGERTPEELARLFGEVASEGQVYLPVRLFARDMLAAGYPLVRYEIRWTPEQLRPLGACLLYKCLVEKFCGLMELSPRLCDPCDGSRAVDDSTTRPQRRPIHHRPYLGVDYCGLRQAGRGGGCFGVEDSCALDRR